MRIQEPALEQKLYQAMPVRARLAWLATLPSVRLLSFYRLLTRQHDVLDPLGRVILARPVYLGPWLARTLPVFSTCVPASGAQGKA